MQPYTQPVTSDLHKQPYCLLVSITVVHVDLTVASNMLFVDSNVVNVEPEAYLTVLMYYGNLFKPSLYLLFPLLSAIIFPLSSSPLPFLSDKELPVNLFREYV